MSELGGFAECPSVIDGSERDWEAYNFCLAESYFEAIVREDWEALGEMDELLIDDICYWFNYDGIIGKSIQNDINNIHQGLIKTCKGRTFIDAIVACHKGELAETFIYNGNHDVRLYLTAIFYGEMPPFTLLNNIQNDRSSTSPEKFSMFFKEIFLGVEQKYNNIFDNKERIQFLEKVKPFIQEIRFPEVYRDTMLIEQQQLDNYKWYKALKPVK